MTLTAEDVRALQAPFAYREHEFLDKKNREGRTTAQLAYITEEAVTARLDGVDPSWSFSIVRIERGAKVVVVDAVLTVKGVSREGIGMQKIDDEFGEAEKGAATDALKRCARLFSIGRYLLDAPKTEREFTPWLAEKQREYGLLAPKPAAPVQQQPEQQQAKTRNLDAIYKHTEAYWKARPHFDEGYKNLVESGVITNDLADGQVADRIEDYYAQRRTDNWPAVFEAVADKFNGDKGAWWAFTKELIAQNRIQLSDHTVQSIVSVIKYNLVPAMANGAAK